METTRAFTKRRKKKRDARHVTLVALNTIKEWFLEFAYLLIRTK